MSIYLDQACTSYPKPESVILAMQNYMQNNGANIGRGGYEEAYEAEEEILMAREGICRLFNAENPECVIFTAGLTMSINMVLKGLLNEGDNVIISGMEHNAVARPVEMLHREGVSVSVMECDDKGELILPDEEIQKLITKNTKVMAVTAASNVTGSKLPLERLGAICKNHGLIFVVDSAQLAGSAPLDMKRMNIDVLCFSGHKGLLGPQGVGGFVVKKEVAKKISPIIGGGTGSFSDSPLMPQRLPDKFEAGTLNNPGIIGLKAAVEWVLERNVASIEAHEMALTREFLGGLKKYEEEGQIKIYGRHDTVNRCPVVSVGALNMDNSSLSYLLDKRYNIKTRVGLHCAPMAHKTIGSYPEGTVRFSFGYANTIDEVKKVLEAMSEIIFGAGNVLS